MKNQDSFKEKSLELIHLTKEFLQLKKTYEDSLGVLILITKVRMLGKTQLESLPQKALAFVQDAKDLNDAEKKTMEKMTGLRRRMSELSPKIKRLSDQLEPLLSGTKYPDKAEAKG